MADEPSLGEQFRAAMDEERELAACVAATPPESWACDCAYCKASGNTSARTPMVVVTGASPILAAGGG